MSESLGFDAQLKQGLTNDAQTVLVVQQDTEGAVLDGVRVERAKQPAMVGINGLQVCSALCGQQERNMVYSQYSSATRDVS